MAIQMAMDWHEGEKTMHRLMRVPPQDNPSHSSLAPQWGRRLQGHPLIAVGTLGSDKRPWATLWGGAAPLCQPLGNSILGVKTNVDRHHDPVVDILFGSNPDGEVVGEQGEGKMIGALTVDLETRDRVKLYGRMVAGAVAAVRDDDESEVDDGPGDQQENDMAHQVQLVFRVDQSLGNCPKYINRYELHPQKVEATGTATTSTELRSDALDLLRKADVFFLSTSQGEHDMDVNHRGGPHGFVRPSKTGSGEWTLTWPEYSGNRLYQSLGNLQETPRAGLVVPNFETGDVLYVTGDTEVLVGGDAAKVLPRSNLAVRLTVKGARFVTKGLPFRGVRGESSPYNPRLRPLADESSVVVPEDKSANTNTATLMAKEQITPTIYRYRFSLSNPGSWTAGQWVALDFSSELDLGYSHMRDDDPLSINDDFVRTFTISSPPAPRNDRTDDEFEVTARVVGNVTAFMSKQRGNGSFEVPIRGFGGEVNIEQGPNLTTAIIAGGIGITPLLAQLPSLDLQRLRVFWTLQFSDIALALDVLNRHTFAAKCFSLFITGVTSENERSSRSKLDVTGANYLFRRLEQNDLRVENLSNRWHLCVSTRLRKTLEGWLLGKELIAEDFNY